MTHFRAESSCIRFTWSSYKYTYCSKAIAYTRFVGSLQASLMLDVTASRNKGTYFLRRPVKVPSAFVNKLKFLLKYYYNSRHDTFCSCVLLLLVFSWFLNKVVSCAVLTFLSTVLCLVVSRLLSVFHYVFTVFPLPLILVLLHGLYL